MPRKIKLIKIKLYRSATIHYIHSIHWHPPKWHRENSLSARMLERVCGFRHLLLRIDGNNYLITHYSGGEHTRGYTTYIFVHNFQYTYCGKKKKNNSCVNEPYSSLKLYYIIQIKILIYVLNTFVNVYNL